MAKEVQRNVVIICGSNKRTLRYVPPLAKVMPHRVICGAFLLLAHEMLLLTMRWLEVYIWQGSIKDNVTFMQSCSL